MNYLNCLICILLRGLYNYIYIARDKCRRSKGCWGFRDFVWWKHEELVEVAGRCSKA